MRRGAHEILHFCFYSENILFDWLATHPWQPEPPLPYKMRNKRFVFCFVTQFNYSSQVAVIKAQCKQCVWLGAGGDTFVVSFSFVCLSDFQKVISVWGVGVAAGLPSHCVTSFVLLSSLDLDSISLDDQSSGSSRRGKLSSFRGHTFAGADRRRHLLK